VYSLAAGFLNLNETRFQLLLGNFLALQQLMDALNEGIPTISRQANILSFEPTLYGCDAELAEQSANLSWRWNGVWHK
jgi:hypothetical protein